MADYPIKQEYLKDIAVKERAAKAAEQLAMTSTYKAIWSHEDIVWLAMDLFKKWMSQGDDANQVATEAMLAAMLFNDVVGQIPHGPDA